MSPPPFDEFVKHSGKGLPHIFDEMHLSQTMVKYFNDKSIELYTEIKVFDVAYNLLSKLKNNNVYLGISTGKDSYMTNLILKNKNLLKYFDNVVCNDNVRHGKPSPDTIYKHIEHSQIKSQNMIFIGDSVSDVMCAHSSGVLSIAALWGLGKKDDLIQKNPTYLASNINDLEDILMRLKFL